MFSQSPYDPFGRGDGFGGPFISLGDPRSSPHERRRRQELARRQRMTEEERRRRAVLERSQRAEEAWRQRMMVEEQWRRADLERRQRAKEEMAHRHEMEILRRARGEDERMRRRYPYKTQPSEKKTASYPPGTVVLGPGGNFYKVIKNSDPKNGSEVISLSARGFGENSSVSDNNKENRERCAFTSKIYDNAEKIDEDELAYSSDSSREWHDCQDLDDDSKMQHYTDGGHVGESADPASPMQEHVPVRKIIVEDVPDEEDEELLEMRSVWRNRVPSPGQWMEPVESFCGE